MANIFQIEVHNMLVTLRLHTKLRVGREVNVQGDCGFDALLAQFEDIRISSTVEPRILRILQTISSPQGLLLYIQLS